MNFTVSRCEFLHSGGCCVHMGTEDIGDRQTVSGNDNPRNKFWPKRRAKCDKTGRHCFNLSLLSG